MATSPVTLPPDFNQWDSNNTLPPDFFERKPLTVGRTVGSFASTVGKVSLSPQFMGQGGQLNIPPDVQQETENRIRQKGMFNFDFGPPDPNGPGLLEDLWTRLKSLNPIAVDKLQSDPSAAIGESAANLLMLRQMFKGMRGQVPEFGSPNAYAEQVGSLGNYTKVQPQAADIQQAAQQAAQAAKAPVEPFTPSPNAPYLLRQRLRELSKRTDYPLSQAMNIQRVREGLEEQRGVTLEAQQAAHARMAEYARKPWENENYQQVPEKVTVGTAAGSANDTALFQKAREVLGANASVSQIAQLAQKMKMGQVPKIGPFPAMNVEEPQVVNNSSDLADLLSRSIQQARAQKASSR